MKISEHQYPLFLPWQAWVLNGFYACVLIVICLWVEPSFHQRLNSFWIDPNEVIINEFNLTQTFLVTTQQSTELTYYLNSKLVTQDQLESQLATIAKTFNDNNQQRALIALDLDPASTIQSQQDLLRVIQEFDLKAVQVSLRE